VVDDALLCGVLNRLDADEALSEEAQLLAVAACQGEDELAQVLADQAPERPQAEDLAPKVEPAGAYLGPVT
jgi:hypothetical protein